MRAAGLFMLLIAFGPGVLVRADEARTVSDADSAYQTPLAVPPEPMAPSESVAQANAPVVLTDDVPMNRPWLMETALGPTAYTLDQKQFQFSLLDMRMVTFDGGLPAGSWVHYGLFDFLTVGLGVGYDFGTGGYGMFEVNGWPAMVELRLNFANAGQWSFGLLAAGRYQLGYGESAGGKGRYSHSAVVGLLSSGVLSARLRTHQELLAVYEDSEEFWMFSYSYYKCDSRQRSCQPTTVTQRSVYDRDRVTLRAANILEWRAGREHVLLFGAVLGLRGRWSYGDLFASLQTRGQFGYHFVSHGGFNLFAGLELGPAFNLSGSYYYGDVSVDAAVSAGINFIL